MNSINNVKTSTFTYKDKEYNFNFFTDININKKISFVNGVTETIVTENHYQPLVRGIVFGFQLINVFSDALSNFKDDNGEERKLSLVEIEDIINNTKIVDIIIENARVGLIDELNDAVDKDIEYKTGIHRNPIGESIASLLGVLEERVKEIDMNNLMDFAEVFKNIPMEEMTPEKLWNAYSKSEAFKKVIKAKENIIDSNEVQPDKIIKLIDKAEKQPKKRGRKPKAKKEEIKEEIVVKDKKDKNE